MFSRGTDRLTIAVIISIFAVLVVSVFLLIKSIPFRQIANIKFEFPTIPVPTTIPTTTIGIRQDDPSIVIHNPPTSIPTNPIPTIKPTIKKNPTIIPKSKPTCYRLQITDPDFVSNKCYALADYQTLLSTLSRYQTAKYHLQFVNASINITCNCQTEQSCNFFKDSCARDKADKINTEADYNLFRTQLQLLVARGK